MKRLKAQFVKLCREDGNSFLMFIFLMPVLCGAFGLGLDTALGNYTRTGIQNAVDTATVAGAAQTSIAGNRQVIDLKKATITVRNVYGQSRKNYPNITGKSPVMKISLINGRYPDTRKALQVTVREKSPTIFMHILGVKELTYNIKSQARLGSNLE